MTSFYNKNNDNNKISNNTLNYCKAPKNQHKKTYYLIRRWCNCRNELLQNY